MKPHLIKLCIMTIIETHNETAKGKVMKNSQTKGAGQGFAAAVKSTMSTVGTTGKTTVVVV
jgi:hypothetical protein